MELGIPRATGHRVVHMRLKLYVCKVQIVREIKINDKPLREQFVFDLLERINQDGLFLRNVVFSDEATIHLFGKVNRHNCRMWGSETPIHFVSMSVMAPK
jgi:hypothetical protein